MFSISLDEHLDRECLLWEKHETTWVRQGLAICRPISITTLILLASKVFVLSHDISNRNLRQRA
jgi:hypothetical protein